MSELNQNIRSTQELLKQHGAIYDYNREVEIGDLMKILWEMCSRKSEYSASIKYCLKSKGRIGQFESLIR